MVHYTYIPFDLVDNPKYDYYKVSIDGNCHIDEFIKEIEENVKRKNSFNSIIAYMDLLGNTPRPLPPTKFNFVHVAKRVDVWEFKKDDLRVYVVQHVKTKEVYVIMGGYKDNQKKDIKTLEKRIKDLPKE